MPNKSPQSPVRRPARHRAPVVQQCQRCGLVLRHRGPWMQMTFCPRCIHAGHVVRLTPRDEPTRPR
jgi:hypothetical protein